VGKEQPNDDDDDDDNDNDDSGGGGRGRGETIKGSNSSSVRQTTTTSNDGKDGGNNKSSCGRENQPEMHERTMLVPSAIACWMRPSMSRWVLECVDGRRPVE
jgi:hypothetical protein